MQIGTFSRNARYLGILVFLSKNKIQDFKFLINEIQARLLEWRQSGLFWVGRYIMITLLLQQMFMYTVTILKVLMEVSLKLDMICQRFWWRVKVDQQNYFCPKAQESMCKPKIDNRLAFKLFHNLNKALLVKLT